MSGQITEDTLTVLFTCSVFLFTFGCSDSENSANMLSQFDLCSQKTEAKHLIFDICLVLMSHWWSVTLVSRFSDESDLIESTGIV